MRELCGRFYQINFSGVAVVIRERRTSRVLDHWCFR